MVGILLSVWMGQSDLLQNNTNKMVWWLHDGPIIQIKLSLDKFKISPAPFLFLQLLQNSVEFVFKNSW